MNPLIKKEIRLIFPAWIAVLVLESVLPWLLNDREPAFGILPYFFFLGATILAIGSFGREFSSGTFQMLMAQPIERRSIWRTKMVILAVSGFLIFLAYSLSCHLKLETYVFYYNRLEAMNILGSYQNSIAASAIIGLVALVGGVWTTLLFRQVATGFWATLLAPAGLATLVFYLIPARTSDQTYHLVLGITAAAYILIGLWAARRLFYSAQDIGWTGGTISLSHWRYFQAASEAPNTTRKFRPVFAILHKEFQLHAITLVGAIGLLIVQIAIFFVRAHYLKYHKTSNVIQETDFFWLLWLLLPLVFGCASVAEERKPGILDHQFCLPVSKRLQFIIKFLPVVTLGVLLGGLVPVALETMAGLFGAPNEMFRAMDDQHQLLICIILYASFGFSLAGFYGSTLAKNFLQALTIAIGVIISCGFLMTLVDGINRVIPRLFPHTAEYFGTFYNYGGFVIIPLILFGLTALVVLPFTFTVASYLNFSHAFDTHHMWRRNVLILAGSLVFIALVAKGAFYRPWELLESIGPTAGPVRLSSQAPAQISADWYNNTSGSESENLISAVLPDGRLWIKYYNQNNDTLLRSHALQGLQQFVDGSNWVAAAVGDQGVLGIRADGTLWHIQKVILIDGSAKLNLSQVGTNVDWFQVAAINQGFAGTYRGYLLLKNNGTLWTWGKAVANTLGPTPYQFEFADPERFGEEMNWSKIISGNLVQLEKTDGSRWLLDEDWEHGNVISQHVNPIHDPYNFVWPSTVVKPDGTLWFNYSPNQGIQRLRPRPSNPVSVQLGSDAKWKSAQQNYGWPPRVIALRVDGTFWKWVFTPQSYFNSPQTQPVQLGNYSGWISLLSLNGHDVALAADGSLWDWNDLDDNSLNNQLLAPSRKPQFIANIFSGTATNP